ncbi:unnamed protein product, partial [Didymodactylos carnosus]
KIKDVVEKTDGDELTSKASSEDDKTTTKYLNQSSSDRQPFVKGLKPKQTKDEVKLIVVSRPCG